MGIRWPWRSAAVQVALALPDGRVEAPGRRTFEVSMPPEISGLWLSASATTRVSRTDALSVPAVLRARNLIAGTLGSLPLHLHDPARVTVPSPLLDQPETGVARSVSMTMLFEDLLLEGVAWWRVRHFAWTGYPDQVERVEPSRVAVQQSGQVLIDGRPVADADVIRFDSPHPGLLTVAARAIRTCLMLDQAAARYASEPMPSGYFTPVEGADPADDDDVQALLDGWASARNTRSTAYIPAALQYQTLQWSPEQLQLADARQHAVLEIARATGIDPEELGVSTTSRSYSNYEQDQIKFRAHTLAPYAAAVEERLSMGDVTPRGYYARIVWDGLLATDTASRYAAYQTGLAVGALDPAEVRELEDKPALPAASQVPVQEVPVSHAVVPQSFSAAVVAFDTVPGASFAVDAAKRTITGMALPYGVTAANAGAQWSFVKGSLGYADTSRVKLLMQHDPGQPIGVATALSDTDDGLSATFKVARGPEGDRALSLAEDGVLDGLSVGVDGLEFELVDGVRLVTAGRLREISLTATPAFDDARVASVRASRAPIEEGKPLPDIENGGTQTATVDTAAFTSAVEAFTAAVERLGAPQGREVVPAGRAVGFQVTEAPVYSFEAGHGPSIVRDTFAARVNGDADAKDRLRKFAVQQAEVAQFATVNRTVGANVIPPGYKPELYVPQLFQGRPLTDLLSKGTLSDATPFTIPKFGSASGATADHVEGTNPSDGTLAFATSVTVTPGAISGRFRITREIIDASNPAIDAIALNALRESYSQQTEGKVYALLNGANGVGGTITAGAVPSGAAVVAATGTGNSAAGAALLSAVRQQIIEYPFRRFAAPDRLVLAKEAATVLALAMDSTGRPLLPRIGATNSAGTVRTLDQAFDVDGIAGVPAWSMTGNAAGDADTIMWNSQDVWAWESQTLLFQYEEVAGPANIDLALFGYFACAVLRGSGFSAVRLTVS